MSDSVAAAASSSSTSHANANGILSETEALPSSEFHLLSREIRDKLKARKAAMKSARPPPQPLPTATDSTTAATVPPAAQPVSTDSQQSTYVSAAAAITPAGHVDSAATGVTVPFTLTAFSSADAVAAAISSTPAAAATTADAAPSTPTPSSSHAPVGFGRDEDFISLKFGEDDDHDPLAPTTPAAGATATSKRGSVGSGSVSGSGVKRKYDPSSSPRSGRGFSAPWARASYTQPNFTHRLHEELLDFCMYFSPKPEEVRMREELVERLQRTVQDAFPLSRNTVVLKPFGSYATQLYLPISDIDFVLVGVDPSHAGKGSQLSKTRSTPLAQLERHIKSTQTVSYLEHISNARIPILKLTDKSTGIKVDICYEIEGGLRAAEFIRAQQIAMPALRPLTLFLKYFLHCRLLNDTYKGGIGSFMLQLMIINHLQHLTFQGRLQDPTTNLGSVLMSFLECYGCSFNYRQAGLNLNANENIAAATAAVSASANGSTSRPRPVGYTSSIPRTSFFNKSIRGWYQPNRPYLLSIENPLDAAHDVGANSYLILRVRKAMQLAYQTICALAHHEAQARIRGEFNKSKREAASSSPNAHPYPFTTPSATPPTLLSHIISVNDEALRMDGHELDDGASEGCEMPTPMPTPPSKRSKHVHKIQSSDNDEHENENDDDDDDSGIVLNQLGEADVDFSSDSDPESNEEDDDDQDEQDGDDDDSSHASRDDAIDQSMDAFEKGFQVDRDDGDGLEEEDDDVDDNDKGAESNSSDDPIDMSVDDEDDDEEISSQQSTEGEGMGMGISFLRRAHRPPPPEDIDFIPLPSFSHSSSSSSSSSRNNRRSSTPAPPASKRRGKSRQYDFSHTPQPPASKKKHVSHNSSTSSKPKKKKKAMLQGVRTDGTRPNSQIYESHRSKKRKKATKQHAKRQAKQQR